MNTKPTKQVAFLKEQQELSDMFEPEKVAHFFHLTPTETEDENAAVEEGMKWVEE